LGAAGYLTKPIARERLRALLARHRRRSEGVRVLVVEDDFGTRAMLKDMLTKEGCEVEVAEDGLVALAKLDGAKPDIILLDLMMPRMDGFEFIEALRGRPERVAIPIVVLTAKELSEEERTRLALETKRVLRKSLHSREELAAEIRRVMAAGAGARANA